MVGEADDSVYSPDEDVRPEKAQLVEPEVPIAEPEVPNIEPEVPITEPEMAIAEPQPTILIRSSRAPATSATSRMILREPITVPQQRYTELARECDFVSGQNVELRRLVESWMGEGLGVRTPVPAATDPLSDTAKVRVRALVEIANQKLSALPSSSRRPGDPRGAGQVLSWLLVELQGIGDPQG